MTMGSLFDGSGGFPLASSICGIEPIWAAEIEPFPIRVTRKRFPNMKHYGDISKINGAEVEPVDIITGGSPCQDMSVAGKRQGMSKHCVKCGYKTIGNADEAKCPQCGAELEYTRSGLFMEQIRIIKEMREADGSEKLRSGRTNDDIRYIRPRFMLWENVCGAFSSNKGEDFRAVLEETARVVDPTVTIPQPDKGKWKNAGAIMGDNWSIAWRTLDAQYWGVPQRRRRIALVADFGGKSAPEILFKRKGLSRNFAEIKKSWQTATSSFGKSARETSADNIRGMMVVEGVDLYNQAMTGNVSKTLNAINSDADHVPVVIVENHPNDSRVNINKDGKCQTLTSRMGTGGGNVPMIMQGTHNIAYGLDRASFNQGKNAQFDFTVTTDDKQPTLTAKGPGAVAQKMFWDGSQTASTLTANNANGAQRMPDKENFNCILDKGNIDYVVRRLTPLECCRLQGFPDWWTADLTNDNPTEEELEFWRKVFETHRQIVTNSTKPKTDKQIKKWIAEEPADGAIYKMWGNGIALPCFLYVMEGIKEELERSNRERS